MSQNKYSIPDYWKSKINQNEEFWYGLFENKPISRESIIINPVIYNPYSAQSEDTWAVYPNPQSVIGFIKFFYLPTAFIGLIEDETENKYYFAEDLTELIEEYKEDHPKQMELILKVEEFYYKLDELWTDHDQSCLDHLLTWAEAFNQMWHKIKGVVLSINIFNSPKETMNYIIESYEDHGDIKMLEEEIGFTKSELIDLSGDNIYLNDFMKRRFTNLLEDRLTMTL